MPSSSKTKGNNFERELVNKAKEKGLIAERAYASNGKALGEAETVDLTINGLRVQAKRRKKIADYLQLEPEFDAVIFRQDRGDTLVLLRYDDLLDKLKEGW